MSAQAAQPGPGKEFKLFRIGGIGYHNCDDVRAILGKKQARFPRARKWTKKASRRSN